MKTVLRILLGIPLSPLPVLLGTWVWLWDSGKESWCEGPGLIAWYLISGQWDKLEC
jgi:hypothetical protein